MDPDDLLINELALLVEENQDAETCIQSGNFPEAAKILVSIVEKDPDNWRAFNNMGIISWEKKAWQDAYTTFKHACKLKPNYSDALLNLFDASLKLKCVDDVLPYLKIALNINPDDKEISTLVESLEEQGEDIYLSERALSIGTYNPRIEEANKLLEDGQLNAAMEKYMQINDEEGQNPEVFSGLGIISYYQKRYKDAYSLFYESIKLNPTDPDTYLNFVDAARECGCVEDAKKIFGVYCEEFPSLKNIEPEFAKIAKTPA